MNTTAEKVREERIASYLTPAGYEHMLDIILRRTLGAAPHIVAIGEIYLDALDKAEKNGVKTPDAIEMIRDITDYFIDVRGNICYAVTLAMRIITKDMEAYADQPLFAFRAFLKERVEGYLLIPADLKPGEKRPLVLTLHGTNIYGKDAPVNDYRAYPAPVKAAEQESRRQRAFAEELVRRGFICFAPDRPGYGKRCPDQPATGVPGQKRYIRELAQRHPGWGYNGGKVLHDLQQALDFLDKLDYVDAARIGTIGHSLGGHDSLYLAAFDPRIAAVVASCPGNMQFQPHLWQSADALAQLCQTAPLGNGALTLNLVLQAIAPRPMMLLHAWNDYLHRPSSSIIEAQITIWSYYVKQLGGDAAHR